MLDLGLGLKAKTFGLGLGLGVQGLDLGFELETSALLLRDVCFSSTVISKFSAEDDKQL